MGLKGPKIPQKDQKFTKHRVLCQKINFCQTPFQLADPTQLQLIGIGVDFVFPRKKNPHLAFSRLNDSLGGVWILSEKCLAGV